MKIKIFGHLIVKILRKLYAKAFNGYHLPPLQREENPDKASDMIYNLLISGKPCMIARFGSTELSALVTIWVSILNIIPYLNISKANNRNGGGIRKS